MRDIVNLNAGPAGLPTEVLQKAQAELLDFEGTGMSVMEHSHRGKAYDAVHRGALDGVRRVLRVPPSHAVFLIQGGASGIFATVPLNFLTEGQSADYVVTGSWSQKALDEAQRVGRARIAGSGEVDGRFVRIPQGAELELDPAAAYLHLTSNNTIAGTQFPAFDAVCSQAQVPVVADMSSDILSRRIDVGAFGLVYAGAQKNLGPSGVTLGIADKAWLERASTAIPRIFRYATHVEKDSLYHTPPTFAVYLVKLVLDWIEAQGGLEAIERTNDEKARRVYEAIEASGGFYRSPVESSARSKMNVVWTLPSEDLDQRFVKEAQAAGLVGLKGHRSVGGIRASIYNAVTLDGVGRLVDFMAEFARVNG